MTRTIVKTALVGSSSPVLKNSTNSTLNAGTASGNSDNVTMRRRRLIRPSDNPKSSTSSRLRGYNDNNVTPSLSSFTFDEVTISINGTTRDNNACNNNTIHLSKKKWLHCGTNWSISLSTLHLPIQVRYGCARNDNTIHERRQRQGRHGQGGLYINSIQIVFETRQESLRQSYDFKEERRCFECCIYNESSNSNNDISNSKELHKFLSKIERYATKLQFQNQNQPPPPPLQKINGKNIASSSLHKNHHGSRNSSKKQSSFSKHTSLPLQEWNQQSLRQEREVMDEGEERNIENCQHFGKEQGWNSHNMTISNNFNKKKKDSNSNKKKMKEFEFSDSEKEDDLGEENDTDLEFAQDENDNNDQENYTMESNDVTLLDDSNHTKLRKVSPFYNGPKRQRRTILDHDDDDDDDVIKDEVIVATGNGSNDIIEHLSHNTTIPTSKTITNTSDNNTASKTSSLKVISPGVEVTEDEREEEHTDMDNEDQHELLSVDKTGCNKKKRTVGGITNFFTKKSDKSTSIDSNDREKDNKGSDSFSSPTTCNTNNNNPTTTNIETRIINQHDNNNKPLFLLHEDEEDNVDDTKDFHLASGMDIVSAINTASDDAEQYILPSMQDCNLVRGRRKKFKHYGKGVAAPSSKRGGHQQQHQQHEDRKTHCRSIADQLLSPSLDSNNCRNRRTSSLLISSRYTDLNDTKSPYRAYTSSSQTFTPCHSSSSVSNNHLPLLDNASIVTGREVSDVITEVGLCNLGNTCYINASLQMLYSLRGLVSDIQNTIQNWEKEHATTRMMICENDIMDTNHEESTIDCGTTNAMKTAEVDNNLFSKHRETTTTDGTSLLPSKSIEEMFPLHSAIHAVFDSLSRKERKHSNVAGKVKRIMAHLVPKYNTVRSKQHDAHEFVLDVLEHMELESGEENKSRNKRIEEEDDDVCSDRVNGGGTEILAAAIETVEATASSSLTRTSTPIPSLIDKHFTINIEMRLVCDFCQYERSQIETHRHLSIDLVDSPLKDGEEGPHKQQQHDNTDKVYSVMDGINRFFFPESRDISCDRCGKGRTCTQFTSIVGDTLPRALVLHINRFSLVQEQYDSQTIAEARGETCEEKKSDEDEMAQRTTLEYASSSTVNSIRALPPRKIAFVKNQSRVQIADALSLSDHVQQKDTASNGNGVWRKLQGAYKLRSVVHHIGKTPVRGHYTADAIRTVKAKNTIAIAGDLQDGSVNDRSVPSWEEEANWYRFDDGLATSISTDHAMNSESSQRNAYMLLYELDEE